MSDEQKFWVGDCVIFIGSFRMQYCAIIVKEDNDHPTIAIMSDGRTQCVDTNSLTKLEHTNVRRPT